MKDQIIILLIYAIIVAQQLVNSSISNSEDLGKKIHNRSIISTIGLPTQKLKHTSAKKWQVGRVSRKQYEIVNMLWRKTKLFEDVEKLTSEVTKNKAAPIAFDKKQPFSFTAHVLPKPHKISTPSYIEFYYLDDNDERLKRREVIMPKTNSMKKQRKADINNNNRNQKSEWDPVLSFYVNEPEFKFVTPPLHSNIAHFHEKPQLRSKTFYNKQSMYDFIREKLKSKNVVVAKIKSAKKTTNSKKSYDEETCPVTFTYENITTAVYWKINSTDNDTTLTTVYDKIKFFETYDQHTQPPNDKYELYDDSQNMIKENYIDSNKRVMLENVSFIGHQHTGLNQLHVKKHVSENFNNLLNNTTVNHVTRKNNASNDLKPSKNYNFFMTDQKLYNYTLKAAKNASKPVLWSDYPFAAVYIYEPSQIHCDAAALSPHWLMASGACLSRYHRKDPLTERRSAFVAYCGEDWWRPERITYVKYIIVHPHYHPKDDKRKYLYNIGLIQVVGSMASACVSWKPISIMSHHFAANAEGTLVTAVGWGVDRYDVRYFQSHDAKVPLHIYKANVYSSSCPGNKAYSEMALNHEEGIVKNIYCLLLPPYSGEDVDPIHGSMLLMGGKLIALYIQEERRPWGVQSALYTGVWKLVPWVHEVAREPENGDLFDLDI